MKKLKKIISVFILIGLVFQVFQSCNKNAYEKPIESDIYIELVKESNSYFLFAKTEKEYPCSNLPIDYTFSKFGKRIKFKFNFVQNSDLCLTALGPATCKINLGDLSTARDYELLFKLNKKENTGKLIFEDSVKIVMNSSTNVFVQP